MGDKRANTLSEATHVLIATVRRAGSSQTEIKSACQSLLNAAGTATHEESKNTLQALGALLDLDDLSRAGFVALVCGAVIENGADPSPVAEPLTSRLKSLLESASALAEFCLAQMAKLDVNDEDKNDAFEKIRERSAGRMPKENAAWEALDVFWRPAVVVYSASPQARAGGQVLLRVAEKTCEYHKGVYWLQTILPVLDNEPIVVLEPATGLGALGKISGVVENFQLQTLLMGQFPGAGLGSRIRQSVLDVVTGIGPQQNGEEVVGIWNMYVWQAIQPDLTLPNPSNYASNELWIWGEGKPADIPAFEGRRVILLGPASYPRSWSAQRMFASLSASLELEPLLTAGEVRNWLQRMVEAKATPQP
jgi:hypothetical protein